MVLKENTGKNTGKNTIGEVENQGRKSSSDDEQRRPSHRAALAMANHWPPETTALIRHAG
jgi:hypothetical protein